MISLLKIISELKINNPSKSFFKFKEEDKYVGKIYTLNGEEFVFNDYDNSYIYIGKNLKNVVKLLNKNKIPYKKTFSPDLTIVVDIEDFNNNLNELEINSPTQEYKLIFWEDGYRQYLNITRKGTLKSISELKINKPIITQQDCINLMIKLYKLAASGIDEVYNEYWEKLEYDWSYFDSYEGYKGPIDFIEQNITTPQSCRLFYKDFKEIYDKYSKEIREFRKV